LSRIDAVFEDEKSRRFDSHVTALLRARDRLAVAATSERFQAKWIAVRVKKTRQNNKL
jgi:hypothetical protein